MTRETIKLELIEWLTGLDDMETLNYLKVVKDADVAGKDWWYDLTDEQLKGIQRGLKDVEEGRFVSNEQVKREYGL